MEESRTVRGEVVLPDSSVPERAADMAVYVEDISRADAPSSVIGEQRQKGVALRPGARIPFTIEVPARFIQDNSLYSIRAHIDVSGSGEVAVGDFVSTETYPVLSRGHGTSATVKVRRV
jgi:putative lipoprotein